jgi:hypothetical protein
MSKSVFDDKFYYCISSEGGGIFDLLMECCATYQAVIQLCYHASNWFISLAGFFENNFAETLPVDICECSPTSVLDFLLFSLFKCIVMVLNC